MKIAFLLCILCLLTISHAKKLNPYKVLGVSKTASTKQIRKAFRDLSRTHHPDHSSDPDAVKKFQQLNQAYDILTDDQKRAAYDQHGHAGLERHEQGQNAGGGGFFGGFSFQSDGRGGFTFNMGQSNQGPVRGPNLDIPVRVSLKDVYEGASFSLMTNSQDTDLVIIEPGMPEGHTIKFSRLADSPPPSRTYGQNPEPGDLNLHIHTVPHEIFSRNGDDLHIDVTLDLVEALVGFTHDLPHLDGHIVKIDKSNKITQHLEIFKIENEGMPKFETFGQFGDLYIRFSVKFPTEITDQQRQTLKSVFKR